MGEYIFHSGEGQVAFGEVVVGLLQFLGQFTHVLIIGPVGIGTLLVKHCHGRYCSRVVDTTDIESTHQDLEPPLLFNIQPSGNNLFLVDEEAVVDEIAGS